MNRMILRLGYPWIVQKCAQSRLENGKLSLSKILNLWGFFWIGNTFTQHKFKRYKSYMLKSPSHSFSSATQISSSKTTATKRKCVWMFKPHLSLQMVVYFTYCSAPSSCCCWFLFTSQAILETIPNWYIMSILIYFLWLHNSPLYECTTFL